MLGILAYMICSHDIDCLWSQKLQFKGECKGGSLGVSVPKSTVVADAGKNDIPEALTANTEATVQQMFDDGHYKCAEAASWIG